MLYVICFLGGFVTFVVFSYVCAFSQKVQRRKAREELSKDKDFLVESLCNLKRCDYVTCHNYDEI